MKQFFYTMILFLAVLSLNAQSTYKVDGTIAKTYNESLGEWTTEDHIDLYNESLSITFYDNKLIFYRNGKTFFQIKNIKRIPSKYNSDNEYKGNLIINGKDNGYLGTILIPSDYNFSSFSRGVNYNGGLAILLPTIQLALSVTK